MKCSRTLRVPLQVVQFVLHETNEVGQYNPDVCILSSISMIYIFRELQCCPEKKAYVKWSFDKPFGVLFFLMQMTEWLEHNQQLFLVNHTDIGTSAQMASELQEEHHQFAAQSMVCMSCG